jgi:hypothetical protein
MDSHNVQRYITPEGYVQNEGDIGVSTKGPYAIAYGSLTPKKSQCENLLVPVCVSSSHIAYGSIRMEPVFMILGQSAATAAVMAIDGKIAVQDVPYAALKARLLADGQVLSKAVDLSKYPAESDDHASAPRLPGITVDDADAKLSGDWTESQAGKGFVGEGYRHDSKGSKGPMSATFSAKLPKAGKFEVFLTIVPNANRATNAKVRVVHAGGQTDRVVNLAKGPDDRLVSLGTYDFTDTADAQVIVSNEGANGYVVIDAINWQAR